MQALSLARRPAPPGARATPGRRPCPRPLGRGLHTPRRAHGPPARAPRGGSAEAPPSAAGGAEAGPAAGAAAAAGGQQQRLDWARAWYPVAALDSLPADRPTAHTVCGTDLVVWRDAGGAWRAWRDACPHRGAPLSEGRVSAGCLQCSYHGWSFDGASARAAAIPQAAGGAAAASPRAAPRVHPTAEAVGLLFVWMRSGEGAAAEAAAAPLPALPAADAAGTSWFQLCNWYVADVPVDYVPLLENSADPAHVHFAHAGFIGSPERAGPIAVRRVAGAEGELRFVVDDPRRATFRRLSLRPPCALWAESEAEGEGAKYSKGGNFGLASFVVPQAPGASRLFTLALATAPALRAPAAVFRAAPWLRHLFSNAVVAQDVVLLHRQGAATAAADWPGWRRAFYTPTASDAGVLAVRRWLDGPGGGGIVWGPNVHAAPPRRAEPRREALFDRLQQHTKNCPSCRAALARARAGAAAAGAAAAACFLGLAAALGARAAAAGSLAAALAAPRGAVLWTAAGLAAALTARAALLRLAQQFVFADWVHADNNA